MQSLSIDYLFNRIFDALLFVKYVWLFEIGNLTPEEYLSEHESRTYDGLRDRGWFDEYFAIKKQDEAKDLNNKEIVIKNTNEKLEELMAKVGVKDFDANQARNSRFFQEMIDGSGQKLTNEQMLEMFESDFTLTDKLRRSIGLTIRDDDGDGIPNSYENKNSLNKDSIDTDSDGLLDLQELLLGTNPRDSDSDKDNIIDGRDEFPLDPFRNSGDIDSDGDGLSDKVEGYIGTKIDSIDSDLDGIFDSIDPYPSGQQVVSPIISQLPNTFDALKFKVENPVIAGATDVLKVMLIVAFVFLIYVYLMWYYKIREMLAHYEHHFEEPDTSKHDGHVVPDIKTDKEHDKTSGGHGHQTSLHIAKPSQNADSKVVYHSSSSHDVASDSKKEGIDVFGGLPTDESHPWSDLDLNNLDNIDTVTSGEQFVTNPKWKVIEGYKNSEHEALWRVGILEADNLLREVLFERGYAGKDVGEMLRNANFKTINQVWEAHKMRNRIAHEGSALVITERDKRKVFGFYEDVFRELKIIE